MCWPVQSSFPSLNKPWTSWHRPRRQLSLCTNQFHLPRDLLVQSYHSGLSLDVTTTHMLSIPSQYFTFCKAVFQGKKMHIYFCLSHVPMELSSMQVGINSVLFTSMSPVLQAILTRGCYAINIGYITDWINIWFSFETPKDNGLSNLPLTILSDISSHFMSRMLPGRKKKKVTP